jgi:hypothetical protein
MHRLQFDAHDEDIKDIDCVVEAIKMASRAELIRKLIRMAAFFVRECDMSYGFEVRLKNGERRTLLPNFIG